MSPSYHSQELSHHSKLPVVDTSLLPAELVDHIIDHLCDDWPSLYQTSLVARLWAHASQRHLLRKVLVHGITDVRTMLPDVHANPRFGAYTTTLKLKKAVISSLSALKIFIDLTRNLPHLQDLTIDEAYFYKLNKDHIPLLHGRDRLRSLTLNSCILEENLFVFALLQAFPIINTLTICNPTTETAFEHGETVARLPGGVVVDHVVLKDVGDVAFLGILLHALSKQSFRRATFDYGERLAGNCERVAQELCNATALYLEELKFYISGGNST